MTNNPLVSIYITTQNRPSLLKKAINSCLSQTYKNIEIIIIDDASTDSTFAICKEYCSRNKNIKAYKNIKILGACASRNLAIQYSRGYFVTGLDDDDIMSPNRITDFIDNHNIKYSFTCSTTIEKNDFGEFPVTLKNPIIQLKDIRKKNHVGNQIFIEKDKILSCGGFDTDLSAWQDFDLWLRLIEKYGPALKIDNNSYTVNTAHNQQRITTLDKQGAGFKSFTKKHSHLLSDDDISSLKICDLKNRNIKLSIGYILKNKSNWKYIFQLLKLYIGQRCPPIRRMSYKLNRFIKM